MMLAASFGAGMLFTGCQTSIGGQTLPSAYYLRDDVQYHTKGPEFKLAERSSRTRIAQPIAEVCRFL